MQQIHALKQETAGILQPGSSDLGMFSLSK